MPRTIALAASLAVVLSVGALPCRARTAAAAAATTTPCGTFANQMLSSCRAQVQADDQLALAICTNDTDRGSQRACQRDAANAQTEASAECSAQYDARVATCRLLGGGAYDPEIRASDFVDGVDNPYFPLVPGTTSTYVSAEEVDVITVTHNTRVIDGVTCIEVHDVSSINGEVAEDTLDWFAQDKDGNVWYFGESSTQVEGGRVVGTEGSWLSGVDGAEAGIIMEAHPHVGDAYRQEFLPGTAEDLGVVLATNDSATVPYGSFAGSVHTRDTSDLEPGTVEEKFYAPGVGSVLEIDNSTGERLELVSVTTE